MATRIDRFRPGRVPVNPPRLRWALPNEAHWDGRQSMEDMWREIAAGTRPCLCPVVLGERRQPRRSPAHGASAPNPASAGSAAD